MQEIQDKFVIKVKILPEQIDSSSYSKIFIFKFSEIIKLNKTMILLEKEYINIKINKHINKTNNLTL